MRRNFHKALLLFVLLASSFTNSAFANTTGDSTNISFQVTVSESVASQRCGFDFVSSAMELSHKSRSDCGYSSEKLLIKARELSSKTIARFDSMQIVTLTVTAP